LEQIRGAKISSELRGGAGEKATTLWDERRQQHCGMREGNNTVGDCCGVDQ
jgi:hypothetical protein